jgi:hypothetical protein
MFFSGQNLLYTFHRSLTAQHVTVAVFKRYARSPENRTFKNYFRKTNPFTMYMHQRPQNSLSRYITKHRRKQNSPPAKGQKLLPCEGEVAVRPEGFGGRGYHSFTTHITTTILEKLQNLQIHYPALTGRDSVGGPSEPSPLGRAKVNRPFRPSAERTESAVYPSRLRSHASGLISQNKPISPGAPGEARVPLKRICGRDARAPGFELEASATLAGAQGIFLLFCPSDQVSFPDKPDTSAIQPY